MELITAMAITAILVVVIMQLTNQGVTLWKSIRQDTSTSAAARLALQTMARDLESIQIRSNAKEFQWLYAEVDARYAQGAQHPQICPPHLLLVPP